MPEIGDVRQREDGVWEICTGTSCDRWEPLATYLVVHRVLSDLKGQVVDRTYTVSDALIKEGWTPPWET